MSEKERHRLNVFNEVERGHLTERASAQQLEIADPWCG
jgi:hypothetical protein